MKINLVVGAKFYYSQPHNPDEKHNDVLLLEDESQTYRLSLVLDRDEKLLEPYFPYWHRTLSLDNAIQLRDGLNKLIEASIANKK